MKKILTAVIVLSVLAPSVSFAKHVEHRHHKGHGVVHGGSSNGDDGIGTVSGGSSNGDDGTGTIKGGSSNGGD